MDSDKVARNILKMQEGGASESEIASYVEMEKAADAQSPSDFSVGEMVSNIPSSSWQLAKDMVYPFMHPKQTAEGLYNVGSGAVQKLIPGEQGNEVYADAVGQFMGDRYGSWDAVKQTAMNDPMGLLSDASAVVTGGGMLLPKVGKTVRKAGMAIDPVNIALNTGKAGINAATSSRFPQKLYQSAAKFSTTMPHDERARLIQTALDNKIMPTPRGVQKLDDMISDLNYQLTDVISTAEGAGRKIHKNVLYKHLDDATKKLGGYKIESHKDLAKLNKLIQEYDEFLSSEGRVWFSPQELQDFKVDAYKRIDWKPGMKPVGAAKKATHKAMARGAREGMEVMVPEVGDINKQLGPLYELQDPLSRSAARIDNRNLLSITGPLNVGGGYALGDTPGALAGAGVSALGSPKIKAANAMLLNQWKNQGLLGGFTENSMIPFLMRQGLLQSGRINDD